jgi:hypothetical protein
VATPQLSQPAPGQSDVGPTRPTTAAKPQATAQEDEENPFDSFVGLLRDSLIVLGVPTRSMFAAAAEKKRKAAAVANYGTIIDATKDMITTFGGAPDSPERQRALDVRYEALDLINPGMGDAVRSAFEAQGSGALSLGSLGPEWLKKNMADHCAGGAGAMECVTKLSTNKVWLEEQYSNHDLDVLPDIMQHFQTMVDAASQAGGDEVIARLGQDGWTANDLLRLPEEYQFTDEQIEDIFRSEFIQDKLRPIGYRPAGGGEGEGAKTFFAKVNALEEIGVPHDIAVKTQTGVFKSVTDDNGRITIVDTTSGQTMWAGGGVAAAPPAELPVEPAVPTISGAEGTGGSAFFKNIANTVTDFFGAGLQFEDAATAITHLRTLRTLTMLGMAGELAGRPTNLVREEIGRLFPEPASLKIGDARSLTKLKAVRDALRFEFDGQRKITANPGNFTKEMVQTAKAAEFNLGLVVEKFDAVIANWNKKPSGAAGAGEFGKMSREEFLDVEITDENVEEYLKEAQKRGIE